MTPLGLPKPWAPLDRNTEALTGLVEDLLDVSRIATGKVRIADAELDLNEVARDSARGMEPQLVEKGVTLSIALAPQRCAVRGDAARLRQGVTNLMSNAVRYTSSGGRVDIIVSGDDARAVLAVQDTRIGAAGVILPPAEVETSELLIHNVGGTVACNVVGCLGCCDVRVLLGTFGIKRCRFRSDDSVSCSHIDDHNLEMMPAINRRVLPRPQRVLIVDDSPDVRELWNLWLTFWGFVVEEACDGADALKKARSFSPHLVLMDVWMPVINGLRATEQLKADPLTANVPVLAVSADTYPPAPQRALDAGCDAFLPKPLHPDRLLDEVRAALRRVIERTKN